jgi:CDP-diacylglycerol--glycerol-3-phosphate 3-phosphatidyltransferase
MNATSAQVVQAPERSFLFRNLPNILTLFRVAAIPLLVVLMHKPSPAISIVTFFIYLVASLTDAVDGYIARRYDLVTPLGKLLDPLADKLLVVSALIMLSVVDRTPNIPGWLLVLIVGRELAVTGLRGIAANEGIVLAAEATGKLKMILQTVGIHGLILHYKYFGLDCYKFGMALLLCSAVVGVWSAIGYHVTVFKAYAGRERSP